MGLRRIIRTISVTTAVLLCVWPAPTAARELTPKTVPVEYHAAMDRIKIGDVNQGILILGDYLKDNPNHPPSVKVFFRYLEGRTSDTIYKRAMKTHFSRTGRTTLFLDVLNESQLTGTGKYNLLKWAERELPGTSTLRNQTLRMALTRGDSDYVRDRGKKLKDQLGTDAGITEFYADWFAKNDRWERAASLYRRLISLRPGYHRGYRGLARYNRRNGHSNRAERLEARARALSAD